MRPTAIPLFSVALLCLVCACDEKPGGSPGGAGGSGGGTDLPELEQTCPEPDGTPVLGDVNGDGRLDIGDPIALGNHLFRGGPAPVCAEAADFNGDRSVEHDDATRMSSYLVSGTQLLRDFTAEACGAYQPWAEGTCLPLGLWWEAPQRVSDASFGAVLSVRSPAIGVEGWSLSLRAEGCKLSAVTTERTRAAEIWDTPPGLRHLGYAASTTVPDGAVSYVLLSFHEDITLPVQAEPSPILAVTVQAEVPQQGCVPCTLSVGDELALHGQPLDLALVAGGRTYRPAAPSATIDVCAP